MCKKEYVSVSFSANLIVFLFFIIVLIDDLIKTHDELASIMVFITETAQGSSTKAASWLTTLFMVTFVPFCIYLVRLNFSLTAFETKKDYHALYIEKLGKFSKILEWVARFMIFILILLGISEVFRPFTYLVERIFDVLDIQFYYNTIDNGQGAYFIVYEGFAVVKDFVFYPFLFYMWLICWNFIVFIGNWLGGNRLPAIAFGVRFFLNPVFGILIWGSLIMLLFTNSGQIFLSINHIYFVSIFPLALIAYTVFTVKSMDGLIDEAKASIHVIN